MMVRLLAGWIALVSVVIVAGCGGDQNNCPSVDFLSPVAGAVLGPNDDVTQTCADGFATNVMVSTNAPSGAQLELLVNGMVVSTQTVMGPTVAFTNIQFDTHTVTPQQLQVRQAGGNATCMASRMVSVDCGTPRCSITIPSASTLNMTNNVSSDPNRFATRFVVETDVENGQPVELHVDSMLDPVRGTAASGRVEFPMVELPQSTPAHPMSILRALCTNRAGTIGMSADKRYTVDSIAPSVTITRPPANYVLPFSAGKQLSVCAKSDNAGQQITAQVEGGMPDDPGGKNVVPGNAMDEVCMHVTCPDGPAPFNVVVTTVDAAGNRAAPRQTNISCASNLPSVRIIDPAPPDVTTGTPTVLNTTNDATGAAGLQYTVTACTDRTSGNASLLINGTQVGSTVAVTAANAACSAAGFVGMAQFVNATLPDTSPAIAQPGDDPTDMVHQNPKLQVTVTMNSDTGASPTFNVWVDNLPPVLSVLLPTCGSILRPGMSGTATTDITISADVVPMTLVMQHENDTPTMITGPAFTAQGQVRFTNLVLQQGHWTLSANATDRAGNAGASPGGCIIVVGDVPTLSFVTPANGQVFSVTTGAMTPVTLSTDAANGSMGTLSVNGGPTMSATVAGGMLSFGTVTLPNGDNVALDATVTDPVRGVNSAHITVTVDTTGPGAISNIGTTVVNRRGGQIRVSWNGAGDANPGGGPDRAVANYDARWSLMPITDMNFGSATPIPYTGTPGGPGATETATTTGPFSLQLGANGSRTYYFAVRAIDRGGNTGPIVATGSGTPLDVLMDFITDATVPIGGDVSGGFDVNGDGIPDVVVGTPTVGGQARIYLGSAGGGVTGNNFIQFTDANTSFGFAVVSLGDFNGDGLGDIAIGARFASSNNGQVYIYFGRADGSSRTWPRPPASLQSADADVTITGYAGTSACGRSLARADFNGDGLADLVIGCSTSSVNTASGGAVAIIAGRMGVTPPLALTLPADAAVSITGNSASGFLGNPVAFAGPMAGNDTLDDILVGAADVNSSTTNEGSCYVFTGRAFGGSTINLTQADAAFHHIGTIANAGQRVGEGVGDINGDGRLDFAVGSAVTGPGAVSLYFGNAAGGFDAGPSIPAPGSANQYGTGLGNIFSGGLRHESLLIAGASPAAADLIPGSGTWNGGDPRVAIFLGRSNWTGVDANVPDAFFTFTGNGANNPTQPIRWVGDLDGDGFDDVVVGQGARNRIAWLH